MECLRKQLNFQEQLYKTKCERVAQLEVETEELKKTNAGTNILSIICLNSNGMNKCNEINPKL